MEFSGIRFEFWCFVPRELFKMFVFLDNLLHATPSAFHQFKSIEEICKERITTFGRYVHRIKMLDKTSVHHTTWGIYFHSIIIYVNVDFTAKF